MEGVLQKKVCPVWVGFFLISPLRRWWQNPENMLRPFVKQGMTVLDVGCAMGFFSLPAARMAGPTGNVICVDMQEGMLNNLSRRASKAGIEKQLHLHRCSQSSLKLELWQEHIDFAMAVAVVHETVDPEKFFMEVFQAMKRSSHFLLAEPRGHVSQIEMEKEIAMAKHIGFIVEREWIWRGMRCALMSKK
jgi:ubiquinone/menaquinone biosynthesis C-methylase UbiE